MIIHTFPMEMELQKAICRLTEDVIVNNSTDKEHLDEIEISNRTVKESTRYIVTTTPLKYLQKLITNIVYFSVLWLNPPPAKMDKVSPRAIVVRTNFDKKTL